MAVSAEMKAIIDGEIATVAEKDYKKMPLTITEYQEFVSKRLANAEEDKDALVKANYDWNKMAKNYAYLELLGITHGERVGLAPAKNKNKPEVDAKMEIAKSNRTSLKIIAEKIAKVNKDPAVIRSLQEIAKRKGKQDILNDIMSYIPILRNHPQEAALIHPLGKPITDADLDEMTKLVTELTQMRGTVISKGFPKSELVARQNRLITLSKIALDDIRDYAEAAFQDNPDYFNARYSNPPSKKKKKKDDPKTPPAVAS